MRLLSLLAIVLMTASTAGAEIEWAEGPNGRTAFVPMENTPFPHGSRAEGHTYQDQFFSAEEHYSDNTVALFVPNGYQPGKAVHLVYYFHGWGNNVRDALVDFRLREMVDASGKNAILVFPEGPVNASDSTWGRLEEPGAFMALTEEVLVALRTSGAIGEDAALGDVVLTGHSGAYRALSFGAKHGGLGDHLKEIYLLDASYALLEPFADWAAASPHHKLRSIFTDHLAADNVALMTMLRRRGASYELVDDAGLRTLHLDAHRNLFVYTTERDHNQAVERLEIFLASSGLPRKLPNRDAAP